MTGVKPACRVSRSRAKSIPDLAKLAASIDAKIDSPSKNHAKSVAGFAASKAKAFDYDQLYLKQLNADIANQKNVIKAVADNESLISRLAPRHLAAVGGRISDLGKQAPSLCDAAVKLQQAGDAKGAHASLGKAIALADQAQEISADLQKALKAGAATVKASKDSAEIVKKLNGISAAVRVLLNQVAQTQKTLA